jgi:hypothetical protein
MRADSNQAWSALTGWVPSLRWNAPPKQSNSNDAEAKCGNVYDDTTPELVDLAIHLRHAADVTELWAHCGSAGIGRVRPGAPARFAQRSRAPSEPPRQGVPPVYCASGPPTRHSVHTRHRPFLLGWVELAITGKRS